MQLLRDALFRTERLTRYCLELAVEVVMLEISVYN